MLEIGTTNSTLLELKYQLMIFLRDQIVKAQVWYDWSLGSEFDPPWIDNISLSFRNDKHIEKECYLEVEPLHKWQK